MKSKVNEDEGITVPTPKEEAAMIEGLLGMSNVYFERLIFRKSLLAFKATGNKALRGHATDTERRPDYIAAFKDD